MEFVSWSFDQSVSQSGVLSIMALVNYIPSQCCECSALVQFVNHTFVFACGTYFIGRVLKSAVKSKDSNVKQM